MCTLTARSIAVLLGVALATSATRAQSQTPNGGNASPLPAVAAASDYRLTPGDKLRVEVYKDAQLSQSLQIRPDGKVTLPLIYALESDGSAGRKMVRGGRPARSRDLTTRLPSKSFPF